MSKSIKISEDAYRKLKEIAAGRPLKKVLEMLVEKEAVKVENLMKNIELDARTIYELLPIFQSIRISGAYITGIVETDVGVRIKGYVDILVFDEDVKKQIIGMLKKVMRVEE